ncbi:MAG TPA: hypothetical protein PLU96_08005 [Methanofastidiosum sp.]|nr:hypothetical protein [Methanofastidiosum sp.]
MKNGEKIDIDEMDINHLRNALKLIVRNREAYLKKMVKDFKVPIKVTLNGDIAQMSIDDEENAEYGNEEY